MYLHCITAALPYFLVASSSFFFASNSSWVIAPSSSSCLYLTRASALAMVFWLLLSGTTAMMIMPSGPRKSPAQKLRPAPYPFFSPIPLAIRAHENDSQQNKFWHVHSEDFHVQPFVSFLSKEGYPPLPEWQKSNAPTGYSVKKPFFFGSIGSTHMSSLMSGRRSWM